MPYIRMFVPEITPDKKREIAHNMTDSVLAVLEMPSEMRDWLTIQFITYSPDDLAVGGVLVSAGAAPEFYIDYMDLEVNQRIKDDLARAVTDVVTRAFGLHAGQAGRVSFRFQALSPDEIAMGGHFVRKLITQ